MVFACIKNFVSFFIAAAELDGNDEWRLAEVLRELATKGWQPRQIVMWNEFLDLEWL